MTQFVLGRKKMLHCFRVPLAILLLALSITSSHAFRKYRHPKIKSSVYLSPKFVLDQGSVVNKYYDNIDFPRGHIAIKGFDAEIVDEAGHPVPLFETYVHHWAVLRYYQRLNSTNPGHDDHKHDRILVRNSGICQNNSADQYFGLGSETRGINTNVPDPFGIEVGNPADIPAGYEEGWMLNVHAIDTRGVEDKFGCIECRCHLYDVSEDEYGRPLRPDYIGGYHCCYDDTQCRVREVSEGAKRNLYIRYTVKWIDWDEFIVPVKIYTMDVTDTWKRLANSTGQISEHDCQVEYDVEPCFASGMTDNRCIDTKRVSLIMPTGGYIIYGVAHQHWGGLGSALYGEDGRVLCSSIPTYGQGKEAGNEAGYLVGMSTCHPQPGSAKINVGETLILESNYSRAQRHIGVMSVFYILVAEHLPKHRLSLRVPIAKQINKV